LAQFQKCTFLERKQAPQRIWLLGEHHQKLNRIGGVVSSVGHVWYTCVGFDPSSNKLNLLDKWATNAVHFLLQLGDMLILPKDPMSNVTFEDHIEEVICKK